MQHRIGLVGCGGIAGSWIKAVDLQEDCRIELTYDLSLEAAKARAAEVGAPTATAQSTDSAVVCHTVDESMFLSAAPQGCSAWMSAFHSAWADYFSTSLSTRGLSHVLATGAHTVDGTELCSRCFLIGRFG